MTVLLLVLDLLGHGRVCVHRQSDREASHLIGSLRHSGALDRLSLRGGPIPYTRMSHQDEMDPTAPRVCHLRRQEQPEITREGGRSQAQ